MSVEDGGKLIGDHALLSTGSITKIGMVGGTLQGGRRTTMGRSSSRAARSLPAARHRGSGGTFDVAANATLALAGVGSFSFSAPAPLVGDGTVRTAEQATITLSGVIGITLVETVERTCGRRSRPISSIACEGTHRRH